MNIISLELHRFRLKTVHSYLLLGQFYGMWGLAALVCRQPISNPQNCIIIIRIKNIKCYELIYRFVVATSNELADYINTQGIISQPLYSMKSKSWSPIFSEEMIRLILGS